MKAEILTIGDELLRGEIVDTNKSFLSEQLLGLGMNQVVYLKSGTCDGRTLFVLFGADGTPVVVADDVEAAVETALEQGLSFVAVH